MRHLEAATRGATLFELAEALPADFTRHQRTIRPDLEALEAAGFPLLTERLDGRVVWKLLEGYRRVPALAFSPTERIGSIIPVSSSPSRRTADSASPSRWPSPRSCSAGS